MGNTPFNLASNGNLTHLTMTVPLPPLLQDEPIPFICNHGCEACSILFQPTVTHTPVHSAVKWAIKDRTSITSFLFSQNPLQGQDTFTQLTPWLIQPTHVLKI